MSDLVANFDINIEQEAEFEYEESTSNKPDIQVLPLRNANQEQINSDQPVLDVGEKETDDRTKTGAKPDQNLFTTSLYVKQTENKGLDNLVKSMPPAVNQRESSSDSEHFQEQLKNMEDKLDARQKELEYSHQLLLREIEENNQIKSKNIELEERDGCIQQQLNDYRVIKKDLTARLNDAKHMLKQKEEDEENMNLNYEELLQDLHKQRAKLQEEKQKNKQKTENFESQIRDLKDRNNKLTAENQDLSRRYSEVASKMLNYNSPNIDDLTTSSEAVDEEEDLCMSSKGMGQLEIKEIELNEMQSVNEQLRAELKEERIQSKTLKKNVQELSKTHGELWAKYAEEQARYLKEMNETTALKEALAKLQTEAKNLSKR